MKKIKSIYRHTTPTDVALYSDLRVVERVKFEWESAVDSVHQLILLMSVNGDVLRVNRALEHWADGDVKNVVGKSVHELLHPDCNNRTCYLTRLLSLGKTIIASGAPEEFRGYDTILNRSVYIRLNPVNPDHTNQDGHLTITFQDMGFLDAANSPGAHGHWNFFESAMPISSSPERQNQGRSRRLLDLDYFPSKELSFKFIEKVKREWESAVDSLPHIICLVDSHGSIVRGNRAVEQWGLGDVSSIRGRHLHAILHPGCSSPHCYLRNIDKLLAKVNATEKAAECQEQDALLKRHLHFQVNKYASFHFPQNDLVVVQISDISDIKEVEQEIWELNKRLEQKVEDSNLRLLKANRKLSLEVEERKRVEVELRASRQEYLRLVEGMNEGMIIQNEAGIVTYANRRFLKMLGLPRKPVIGKHVSTFISETSLEFLKHGKGKKNRSKTAAKVVQIINDKGEILWAKLSPQPFKNDQHQHQGSFSVITDVTDYVDAELKLLHTESELKALSKQVLHAQELERKRIASELHDGLGQTLSAIKFYMENNLLAQLEETDLNVNFEKIIPKLQAAIDEVRRISMDLRPSLLDDIGIMATLKWFIRETRLAFPSTQFDIEMHGLDENTLTPELKTAIFRIVQEAINNASKHSRARIIRLGLKGDKQNFTLEIADDGCGFPVDEVEVTQGYRESKGLGIASMRERAMSCGGSFSIESKPDAGTRIKCVWSRNSQLPLDKRKAVQ